jgi:hypothetical protein
MILELRSWHKAKRRLMAVLKELEEEAAPVD